MPEDKPTDTMTPEALGALIDERVTAGVTARIAELGKPPSASSTPPAATPPATGGAQPESGLAAQIDAALARAFKDRDDEDALGALEREIEALKTAFGAAPNREQRKRGWGSFLVGMGR